MTETESTTEDGACCEACAVRATPPAVPTTRTLPVLDSASHGKRVTRDMDRRITMAGLLIAAGFVGLATLGAAHLAFGRTGLWIPLHLALAGAASTAVASVLPFFTTALAAAPPADPGLRAAAIGAIAVGALLASIAVPMSVTSLAVLGGMTFVGGIVLVAIAAIRPLRHGLGIRRPLIEVAYGLALTQVALGALLATAFVAGVGAVAANWALLKPAHAWLNVFGFLAVVIAATLVHLAPTVVGGRIKARRSAIIGIGGLAAGPPLVAVGMAFALDPIARIGAATEIVGSVALVVHAVVVLRDRGRWTTDRDWHRFTTWSLSAAPIWLLVTTAMAAGSVLRFGAAPAAWSVSAIATPLTIGFVGQVLIGSWSHLVPAVGPGSQAAHAEQRAVLGRAATARLAATNVGAALIVIASLGVVPAAAIDLRALSAVGLALALGSILTSLLLLAGAARIASRPTAATIVAGAS